MRLAPLEGKGLDPIAWMHETIIIWCMCPYYWEILISERGLS